MKKRMLSMLLTIVILVGLMPATVLADEAYGTFAPTSVNVSPTLTPDDDDNYITIKWTTENRIDNVTIDDNIRKSYLIFVFKKGTGTIADGGNKSTHWYNTSITEDDNGNQILQLYFKPELLERKYDTNTAYFTLRITPGTVLSRFGEANSHSKIFGGRVSFYGGKSMDDNTFIASAGVGNASGYNSVIQISSQYGNLLWSTSLPYKSMNEMKLAADKATISAQNSYLPKGETISTPINVSAMTELGTDAAHAYTGAANYSLYLINQDVYAKVTDICYTGTNNYSDSIYFSEDTGKLYLNVKENIYDKIGTDTIIQLPLRVTVKQTLTNDTVTASKTIKLARPEVGRDIYGTNIRGEWIGNNAYYKIAQQAKLTANDDYQLPASITVTVGEQNLLAGTDYTYDPNTGIVNIPASSVTGDIVITASADNNIESLDDITGILPDFDEDIWYNESNSTLTTAQGWRVSTSKNGDFSNTITLDGEGVSLTKTLFFSDNDGRLYSYELTYIRDITPPVISEISGNPAEGTYNTSAEIGFTASDATSGIKSVTVTCDDGESVTFDGDSFIADRNGTYTISLTDGAYNEITETVTVENIHSHSYSYAVNAENTAQIIESCSCGHKQTATLAYSAGSGSYTYTGSAITPVQVTYSEGWVGDRQAEITYSNNINAGTGAKGTLTIGGATATKTFVITKETPTLTAPVAQNSVIYGAKLSEVDLSAGWVWANGNIVPNVQNSGYTAYYTPADTRNYDWTQISGWNAAEGRVERTVFVTVNKADLSVTAENKRAIYGDAAPNYTVSYEGFKNGDDESTLGGTLAFNCDYAQFSDKGEYTIKASGYTSDNYNISYVDGALTVSAKPITVTIQNATSVYGNRIAELKATSVGIVNGDIDVYSLSTTATSTSDVGEYAITGTTNNSNYNITFKNGTNAYTITRRELTVTVEVADKKYDGKKDAEITSAVLNNVANDDNIVLTKGIATFETVNVKNDVSISFTDFAISGDKSNNYTIIQPTGIKANITNGWNPAVNTEYTVSEPNSNGWLKDNFVITAKTGYKLSLTNTADGEWKDTLIGVVESADGKVNFYVKNTADGTISEITTESYKLDKANPAGKVSFDERNGWEEFLHTISFGLFYKNEVSVKAEATDSLSGVAKIEFFESSEEMSLADVQNSHADWKELPENGKGVTFEDAKQFIYYIRITDNAGNVTYISTNGAEYDTTVPVISGIENGAIYYTTQKVTVTDKNADSIELNGENENADIVLDGNVDKNYIIVATDKAGNKTTVTVTMKPISSISSPIDSIKEENVKSSDKESIEQIKVSLQAVDITDATETEKALIDEMIAKCDALLQAISDVTAEITELTDAVNSYASASVKSSDKDAVEKLFDRVEALLNGDTITENERENLESVKGVVQALLNKISAVAEEFARITEETGSYELKTVTADDKGNMEKLKDDIDKILATENLTDEEISQFNVIKTKLENCLDRLEGVTELIDEISKGIEKYEKSSVKSTDKEAIKQIIKDAETLIGTDNVTVDEKTALESIVEKGNQLLDKITELAEMSETQSIKAADDIKADNVVLKDKETLEDALKDLTEALEKFSSNYTEIEKAELQDKINRIEKALDVIEKVETVKELIDKLPDAEKVKLSDEKAISSAKEAYDNLSDYEKKLVDTNKLNKVIKAFENLSDKEYGDAKSPDTGDNTPISLWFVIMISAAFCVVRLSIYSKKEK